MSVCLGMNSIVAALATIAIGEATPDSVRSYIAINADPWDNNAQIDFKEPMGTFGLEYDLDKNVRVFAEHLSSPMQCDDHPGINHAGIKFLAPVDAVTVYSGISINNSVFDSNDRFDGPLVSLGAEYGKDVKVYAEYLAAMEQFEEGRISFGIKVMFK